MERTSLRVFTSFLLVSFTLLFGSVELDYLNSLRTKTGLPPFSSQTNLTAAAQNHSAYMQTNNSSGHGEVSIDTGFTGASPFDRVVYAGYLSRSVGENVSYGSNATYTSSIDNLFSAIYHRFGFLGLTHNEIGIGISNNKQFYTYDMGNHQLNLLCQNPSYTGSGLSYYHVCADTEKKIKGSDFISASDAIKNVSPALILWPADNSTDIPPVFYEESPDPLPSDSVTGYPVSVQFNEGKFTSAPTMSSFTLTDANSNQVSTLITMNHTNDPNGHFSAYEFALFPENRLEWGSQYSAEIIYDDNGTQKIKSWSFVTRSLKSKADRFYRIENNADISLNVISGERYALYVVPNNTNDSLGSLSYRYTSNAPSFSYIDSNTVTLTLTGSIGQYASFTFANGQKIRVTIASTDNATLLTQTSSTPNTIALDTDNDGIPNDSDVDDDNDGISDSDELANGLDPLNASDAQLDFDNDGFTNALEISVGSNIHSASSKPIWVPVMVGDIIIYVPHYDLS